MSQDLLAQLTALEVELHRPAVQLDRAKLSALLHPEFVEFGRSGSVWTRQAVLDELTAATSSQSHAFVHAEGFVLQASADDLALLTYQSAHVDASGKRSRWTLRSSLWQRHQGEWVLRFHQGTPMERSDTPPPAP